MSGKKISFLSTFFKFLIFVGVMRSGTSTNHTNHQHQHQQQLNSSSHFNSMMMLNDLCELPLDQLLKVKKSLRELHLSDYSAAEGSNESPSSNEKIESRSIGDENKENFNVNAFTRPNANAIAGIQRPHLINRKSGYGGSGGGVSYPSEKSSKIQSFFQISVTALAFLAFAGYLLCMIVQAIKSKGTMYTMVYPNIANMVVPGGGSGTLNSLTNSGSVPLRKRRPVGRRKRRNIVASSLNGNSSVLYNNHSDFSNSSILILPSSLEMYDAFLFCAEDYTKLYV